MREKIIVRLAKLEEIHQVFDIRRIVFVIGQDCPPREEFDGLDDDAIHFIAFYGEKLVGTARLREVDEQYKLERIAVLEKFRGFNIGTEIVKTMLNFCKSKKNLPVYLHSQEYAIQYYKKFGFSEIGEQFFEANIPHRKMTLKNR
ncbi:MAG: GNAT family N-acetyltransferase [Candidatus Marinimicrobia bacterium]|nr:GNAT family N-acetyltransferase [Candidatus Neomarinimicrobiota bacterium]